MKKSVLVALFVLAAVWVTTPALAAQEEVVVEEGADWGILAAAVAIGVAAAGCGLGQGRAISSACEGMARNPGATGNIRTSMLIGLAFIESLAIYALLIALRGAGFI